MSAAAQKAREADMARLAAERRRQVEEEPWRAVAFDPPGRRRSMRELFAKVDECRRAQNQFVASKVLDYIVATSSGGLKTSDAVQIADAFLWCGRAKTAQAALERVALSARDSAWYLELLRARVARDQLGRCFDTLSLMDKSKVPVTLDHASVVAALASAKGREEEVQELKARFPDAELQPYAITPMIE